MDNQSQIYSIQSSEVSEFIRDPLRYKASVKSIGLDYSLRLLEFATGCLSTVFPYTQSQIPSEDWDNLIREFYYDSWAHSFSFHHLAESFVKFVQAGEFVYTEAPYFQDLIKLEWTKLKASMHQIPEREVKIQYSQELINGEIAVSPFVWVIESNFEIHKVHLDSKAEEIAQNKTYLLISYINQCLQVKSIDSIEAKAILTLQSDMMCLTDLVDALNQIAHLNIESQFDLTQKLYKLQQSGIILGTVVDV